VWKIKGIVLQHLSIEKYLDGCVKIVSLGRFFFSFSSFVIMHYLFLGTKSLMQHEL